MGDRVAGVHAQEIRARVLVEQFQYHEQGRTQNDYFAWLGHSLFCVLSGATAVCVVLLHIDWIIEEKRGGVNVTRDLFPTVK